MYSSSLSRPCVPEAAPPYIIICISDTITAAWAARSEGTNYSLKFILVHLDCVKSNKNTSLVITNFPELVARDLRGILLPRTTLPL